jgi:alanyl-tRNA synthetase
VKSTVIRQQFIDFFKQKGHTVVPPASIVPENDPTLLFTNAGMNQFKPYFLGSKQPTCRRAVNAQPCIRVSGKHNDLEDVGFDTYHHTSFEMLGNWSFGDYYKKEAILWSWELMTEVYRFNKNELVVTVYDDDKEAHELWQTLTDISPSHIVFCPKKHNFWEMGATGPCGPCSEIHLDLAPGGPVERDPDGGLSNRYMELWNLVFIQYDRHADDSLMNLPQCHVDTGAGLERLAAQLQGCRSNYDTDCFKLIIDAAEYHLGVPYDQGVRGTAHRVIADHIRTLTFGLADNVIPSNEGRGYVLRRLLRRALRFASQAGKNTPFLHELVPVVNDTLGGTYTHITQRLAIIQDVVKSEEIQFLKTVESGIKLFHGVSTNLRLANQTKISGDVAFKLYDTYGFPLDLTQMMAKEHHLTVDTEGFELALNAQKQRSREARTETLTNGKDDTIVAISRKVGEVISGIYIDHPGGGEARIPCNAEQRFGLAQHHTATHLLNESLRRVLGPHVQQAGSLVDVNRLRFDFTHSNPVTPHELSQISATINDWIMMGCPVTVTEEDLDAAKRRGAQALFGETYGEVVRVVDIKSVSIELCGGNHVVNTEDLQEFSVVAESSVAAGVRRIDAIVGHDRVAAHANQQRRMAYNEYLKKWKLLSNNDLDVPVPNCLDESADSDRISVEMEAVMGRLKQLEATKKKREMSLAGQLFDDAMAQKIPLQMGGVGIFKVISNQPLAVLRELADRLVSALGESAVVVASHENHAGHCVAKVSKSMRISATDLVNAVTAVAGGRGGGKPTMAQAGGLSKESLQDAIDSLIATHAPSTISD